MSLFEDLKTEFADFDLKQLGELGNAFWQLGWGIVGLMVSCLLLLFAWKLLTGG